MVLYYTDKRGQDYFNSILGCAMNKDIVKIYDDKAIRTIWDSDKEKLNLLTANPTKPMWLILNNFSDLFNQYHRQKH